MKIEVNMGDIWDRATEFLGDHLSPILPIAVLAIMLPSAVSSVLDPIGKTGGVLAVGANLFDLALVVVGIWGQLAIVAWALHPAAGRGEAMRIARDRLFPLIGIIVLLVLLVVLVVLPIPIALIASGFDMQAAMSNPQPRVPASAGWFVSLYALVLLPIMLFASVRLPLLTQVVVAERRGLGAIRRAFALTHGLFWKILGVMILYVIVAGVAMLAAGSVFGSVFRIVLGGEGPLSLAAILAALAGAIVRTVFVLLAAAFTAKLYLAVRDARETPAPETPARDTPTRDVVVDA